MFARDTIHTDTPDSEHLLGTIHSEKTVLPSLQVAKARTNGQLKTYLHLAAVVLYSAAAVALYAWSQKLNEAKCACHNAAVYSPADTAVQYEKHTIIHNLAGNGKYRGPPRQEQDEAWDELLRYYNLRIQGPDLERANLTSVALNDAEGGYLATLDVFHTLHCVNKVRKSYYGDYYHDPNPLEDQRDHFDHCIDLLRQVIMCHGDTALHPYSWIDDYRAPWPSMQTQHQCRSWDALMGWAEEHHVPSLMGPILSHPTLGTSYRGDEPTG